MNYYYLISGLPDLSLTMDSRQIATGEVFDTICRNLTSEDRKGFRYLIHPNDNRNLLNHLFHEFEDLPESEWISPGFLEQVHLSDIRRNRGVFPAYMVDFLVANEDRFHSMTMREMEEGLWSRFYEEVEDVGNPFIKDYFEFYRSLRALLATFHRARFDFLSKPQVPHAEWLGQQLSDGLSPSPSLSKHYPYAEKLSEVFTDEDPGSLEQYLDSILWDYLEEKQKDHFSAEQVYAYTLRLLLVSKKQKLTNEKEKTGRFDKIKQKVREQAHTSKTTSI